MKAPYKKSQFKPEHPVQNDSFSDNIAIAARDAIATTIGKRSLVQPRRDEERYDELTKLGYAYVHYRLREDPNAHDAQPTRDDVKRKVDAILKPEGPQLKKLMLQKLYAALDQDLDEFMKIQRGPRLPPRPGA
jgi:hypothetical protein